MRTSCRGSDRGNALIGAVVLLLVFSLLFLSFVPRVMVTGQNARLFKERALIRIEKENGEILQRHDVP
jgi:competence protein ComGC